MAQDSNDSAPEVGHLLLLHRQPARTLLGGLKPCVVDGGKQARHIDQHQHEKNHHSQPGVFRQACIEAGLCDLQCGGETDTLVCKMGA